MDDQRVLPDRLVRTEAHARIRARVSDVEGVAFDPRNDPRWHRHVERVAPIPGIGDRGVASYQWTIRFGVRISAIGDVLAYDPGRVQVIQMRSGVLRPTITQTLDATDRDLTTFSRLVEVPIPVVLWPLRRIVYELFRRQNEQAVFALKRLLEGHASPPIGDADGRHIT